jgi:transposase
VLLAAEGLENKEICANLDVDPNTVGKWRRRFSERRVDGLLDEPRPGRPREIGDDEIAATIRLTLETTPRGATHWSLRSMAQAVGHAPSTVHRIWQAFGLQPHPRWHVHFTPTSASWLNQVERFFAELTEKQIRRGVHRSTHELEGAIGGYIETVNDDPKHQPLAADVPVRQNGERAAASDDRTRVVKRHPEGDL